MANYKLKIATSWTGGNFCCVWSDEAAGTVAVTAKTLEKLKDNFRESLKWHIEGCLADGDVLPDYLVKGDYDLEFDLDTAAIIRNAEDYTTMAAISRATGINQKLLSHYANGIKHPRAAQRERIISGLRLIASRIMVMC